MKQEQKVIEYFIQNNNEPKHFEKVAKELEILIPNVRRILGQGTLKGVFNRVDIGVYEFAHYEIKQELSKKTGLKLNDILINDNGNISINKDDFNLLLNSVNDNEKEILKTIIK